MKISYPISLLFFIFFLNTVQAQLYYYDVELIKQKVAQKLKHQMKTNEQITDAKADWFRSDHIIWQTKKQQVKLTLKYFGDIVTAQDKLVQKRMILSNASRQETLRLGDEAYLFSSHKSNNGTILVRKANIIFHFSANDLKKVPRLTKAILKTLILIPPPPKAPTKQNKLTSSNLIFFKNIKNNILANKKQQILHLDTLSKIVLNDTAFYLLRMEAIQLISQMPIQEAKVFLFNNIGKYMYDETYDDRVFYHDNIPCYNAFLSIKNFDLYQNLFRTDYLKDCLYHRKLELLVYLIKRDFGEEIGAKILEIEYSKAKEECLKVNLLYMVLKISKS